MFNGLYRAEGWPDFARALARTRAGDGYGREFSEEDNSGQFLGINTIQ